MFTFSNIISKNKFSNIMSKNKNAPKGKYHFGRMEPINMIIEFDGKTFAITNPRGFVETNDYRIDVRRLADGGWYANAHFETEPPAELVGPEIVHYEWQWIDL